MTSLAITLQLSREDLFGHQEGDRVIIHKLPEHVVRIYQAFGFGEQRLKAFWRNGAMEVFVYFHPNIEVTELYVVKIQDWLEGIEWNNTLDWGKPERQRLMPIDSPKCRRV